MTHLEIEWPDAMVEQVRAARGRLECAGEVLRTMSLEQRLQSTARVLGAWTAADSPWRRELVTAFAADSPFHEATVREGLDAALRAWKPDALVACARRELAAVLGSNDLVLSPFAWTAVLAGGAVPMPTMLSVLLPLILGSPVLLRETANDRTSAALLKRSLEAENETLARSFEHLAFSVDDLALDSMLEAPCIVATGSDETIRSIAVRIRPNQRFLAYGHRFSIGVFGLDCELNDAAIRRAAEGFAIDVARWDQTGCLSPVVIYLLGGDAPARKRFATETFNALERVSRRMPRGGVTTAVAASQANERAEARMRQAASESPGETLLFEAEEYTVILEAGSEPRPAPLHRFLRLMPIDSLEALERVLGPFAGQLSNAAIAGFSDADGAALRRSLTGLGLSRLTEPGRLQTPPIDWPHDGMPLLSPIARFTQPD